MIITGIIIAKAENISKKILNSLGFVDEIIIVVDSPVRKVKQGGKIKTYFRPLNNNFADQRNFALSTAKNDWVLFIDDDEYVSSELAREISLLKPGNRSGFYVNRIDTCFHQRLLHGETGHTKLLRLARKGAGKYIRPVHETWQIKGGLGELSSPLYHIKDSFISEFIDRMTHYAQIDAGALANENKPFTFWRLFFNPKAKFIQNFFVRGGLLDGTAGLFQAYLMSIQSLTVRIFQWKARN
jgi:glycosyltransferase involved in cell wall biosynthesis